MANLDVMLGMTMTYTGDPRFISFTKGDRVRIREGYDGAGAVYYYRAKDANMSDQVVVDGRADTPNEYPLSFLAAAIEPYPYSREERIERAIEDFWGVADAVSCEFGADDTDALLFAIIDAGV